ncbi:MAG: ATP-grasp domain-containing protein [Myxococcales bacterium]|nr:ATP-grasp domain-containing protein [Myxococcales bacterium]
MSQSQHHVLFVAPYFGPNMLRCVDALAALDDVRLGIISHEPAERMPAALRERVDGHYQIADSLDPQQLTAACRAFQQEWGRVDRLLGYLEQMQVQLAIARDRCGIPGMGEAVARNFREKNRMKATLRDAGLPVARQALLTSLAEAERFVAEVGYPIVLKPPAGVGSRGTLRATNAEELRAGLVSLLVTPSNPVQAEEFIQGSEHTFETVSIGGDAVWSSSSYYLPRPLEVLENPWIQYCVLLPRERMESHAAEFRPINAAALRALGVDTALSHMEWFIRPDGSPVISEVGARPPGVHLMPMMGYCHGVDMWAKWANLMVRGEFTIPERRYACGAAFFRGQGRGQVVREVTGLDAVNERVGDLVVESRLPTVGQYKASGYEGEGYAIVRAETTREVVDALRTMVQGVRVVLG